MTTESASELVEVPASMQSWLRKRLVDDAERSCNVATIRTILLLRGVRGRAGQLWLADHITEPKALDALVSGGSSGMHDLLQDLLCKALQETERMAQSTGQTVAEAGKFFQLGHGRHAGQSGLWWLKAVARDIGTLNFEACVAHMAAVFPAFGWLAPLASMPPPIQRCQLLLPAALGVYPVADGRAGKYTAMDAARCVWLMAKLLGKLPGQVTLDCATFSVLRSMQMPTALLAWEWVGVEGHEDFLKFGQAFTRAAQNSFMCRRFPPPEGAPTQVDPTWAEITLHLCEIGTALRDNDVGPKGLTAIVTKAINPEEEELLAHTVCALRDGRLVARPCALVVLVQTLAKHRAAKQVAKHPTTDMPQHAVACALVRYGLSMAPFWWLSGVWLPMFQIIGKVRATLVQQNSALRDLLGKVGSGCGPGQTLEARPLAPQLATPSKDSMPSKSHKHWARGATVIQCPCGVQHRRSNKAAHKRSATHQAWEQQAKRRRK